MSVIELDSPASQRLVWWNNPNLLWVLKASYFIRNICLFISRHVFVYTSVLAGRVVVSHSLLLVLCMCENCWGGQQWSVRLNLDTRVVCVCVVGRQVPGICHCSRLIACFSQTQRLVPLPVTPRCECVCVCVYVTRRGLKTGLVSSGSKPEQIDRNKVLRYSKWSVWPHIKSDFCVVKNKQWTSLLSMLRNAIAQVISEFNWDISCLIFCKHLEGEPCFQGVAYLSSQDKLSLSLIQSQFKGAYECVSRCMSSHILKFRF